MRDVTKRGKKSQSFVRDNLAIIIILIFHVDKGQ